MLLSMSSDLFDGSGRPTLLRYSASYAFTEMKKTKIIFNLAYGLVRMRAEIFMGNVRLSIFILAHAPCPVFYYYYFSPIPSILRFSLARAHFCLCVCACFLFTLAVSRLALRAHKTQCGTDVKYYKWETVCRASRRNYSEEQITRKRCGNLFKRHQQGIHHVIQTV